MLYVPTSSNSFTLGNICVYISTSDSSNLMTYIEVSVNEAFYF